MSMLKKFMGLTAFTLRKTATGTPKAQAASAPVARAPAVPADTAKPYRILLRTSDGFESIPATREEFLAYCDASQSWRRIAQS